jgi:hypothetical protein
MNIAISLFVFLILSHGAALIAADSVEPRAARSVHLGWIAPEGDLFYQEMTIERSVPGSYFMAAGWNTGYFGLQELSSSTNKIVLFSVWDRAKGNNPTAVPEDQRVEVMKRDPDVIIKRFGGEGTGGQCKWNYLWKTGEVYRFVVQAVVQSNKTAYAGYFFHNEENRWKHLVTFRTLTGGSSLKGYYSFVEDFRRDGRSVRESRRATFTDGWVRTTDQKWLQLTRGRFTASNATWEDKDRIDAGVIGNHFYLATGGETITTTALKSILTRPSPKSNPPDLRPEPFPSP